MKLNLLILVLGLLLSSLLIPRNVTFIAFLEGERDIKIEEEYYSIVVNKTEVFSGELGFSFHGYSEFECKLNGGPNKVEVFNSEGDKLFSENVFILFKETCIITIWEENIDLVKSFGTFMFA